MRRWIATILLKSNLESHLIFNRLSPVITCGFDTSAFTKDNQEDADFIRSWLESELQRCDDDAFDEQPARREGLRRSRRHRIASGAGERGHRRAELGRPCGSPYRHAPDARACLGRDAVI